MEFFEDPDTKKTYERCKYIVKLWEHKFKKKHKRLPSRLDIKEANSEVRNAYKCYFKLKTDALEFSFRDVEGFNDDEDDFVQKNDSNNSITIPKDLAELIDENNSPKQIKIVEKTSSENAVEPEKATKNTSEVWGTHLNYKKKDKVEEQKETEPNTVAKISSKLFNGAKFSKRNPRKSLSFSSKNKSKANIENNSFSLSQATSFSSFEVDEPLQSLSQENFSFISNTLSVIPDKESASNSLPVNLIQNVIEKGYSKPIKTIDRGWLERLTNKSGIKLQEENGFNSQSIVKTSETTKIDYDSEDIIEESEDEDTSKNLTSLHAAKKRKLENAPLDTKTSTEQPTFLKDVEDVLVNKEGQEESQSSQVLDKDIRVSGDEEELKDVGEPNVGNVSKVPVDVVVNLENSAKVEKNISSSTESPGTKSKSINSGKKSQRNKKSKTLKPSVKNSKAKTKSKTSPEITTRRSLRSNKVQFSLQESSSDEELEIENLDFSVKEEEKKHNEKPIRASTRKTAVIKETSKDAENKLHELEFSVKSRIVAPRYGSIKKMLVNEIIAKKKSNDTTEKITEKVQTVPLTKTKNQQAKEILEKKIASGKLNENFVRIDIKKKVFVRGKRKWTTSQIKKSQWKSKKAKSLYGPNMDMGGCDGGTLTCFQCGQTGHFARYCKAAKGDELLPANAVAEEEECPYPTLEEASQMVRQSSFTHRTPKLSLQEKSVLDANDSNKNDNTDNPGNDADVFGDDFDSDILLQEALKLEEQFKSLDVEAFRDTVTVVKPYYSLDKENKVIGKNLM